MFKSAQLETQGRAGGALPFIWKANFFTLASFASPRAAGVTTAAVMGNHTAAHTVACLCKIDPGGGGVQYLVGPSPATSILKCMF